MSKKHNVLFWIVSIILCIALFFTYQRFDITKKNNSQKIRKIVTLIPSVQEIVSYIGGEEFIVGVSQHSVWPESIKSKEKIAGFSGVDYEKLSKLAPDIVIDSGMVKDASEKLEKMGIKYLQLKENSVQDILDSMLLLGKELGLEKNAQKKVNDIKKTIEQIKARDNRKEKMLITVGHSDELKNLYIAGKDNLFDELISLAGFINGYEGKIMYPSLSAENVVGIDPDIVVILNEAEEISEKQKQEIINPWLKLPVKASKNKKIFVLNGNHVFIPGPRFIKILKSLSDY